ncbi:MAG TPA: lysophospholipid acyltransferase family protein [Vicinamibacterales bacterium]|nr:lysophospholipid acyltransferase family protein [Vicinamibacterales bacterium]
MTHRLETLAVRAVMALVRLLPERLVAPLGAALGSVVYLADARHRRVALANVAAALPERSARERRAIVRGAFRHFGRLLFELLKFGTLPVDRMMARVEFEGEDLARAAYAQGRGVLFVTGHFGFWELHAMVHAVRLAPIGLLARALDNPRLHDLLESIRQRTGNFVIYRQATIRRVMRALQEGQGVAVLIDQHIQARDAVFVDFFDRPAATTGAVAALALRTGAPVVPVFALPIGRGRYRMIYERAVEPPPADAPEALREFTQRITRVLEDYVRRDPDMWLWMHRRWRGGDLTDAPIDAATPGHAGSGA